ncbi:hypothetical protein ACP70R_002802 [Stipagrostis hirtigluma subsp. patula]
MRGEVIHATDVNGAREEILKLVQRNIKDNIIYFDGWCGFGASAVLRSIVLQSMKAPHSELCFTRAIYIDCSAWKSKRVMQRRIAEELKFDSKTMAMFEKKDEEDDFSGVDYGSRDVIRVVSAMIARTLMESKYMMVFLIGSDDEVTLNDFGVTEWHDCTVIWTFRRRSVAVHNPIYNALLARKLFRSTVLFTYSWISNLSHSQLNALFHEEAATVVARNPCMRHDDKTMVIDCLRYGLFLHQSFHSTTRFAWAAHATNFWICDGIIQEGDRTREITNALRPEINFEGDFQLNYMFDKMMQHPDTSYLVVEDDKLVDEYEKRPCRWISVTSKNKILQHNMQTILARASSIFLAFKRATTPRLPNVLFKQCNHLAVLILSWCAFNFASPPFLHCHRLRLLGVDNCTHHNSTTELEGGDHITKWAFLHSLQVLDLRYTDWVEILFEEKIDLMVNLIELNMEGVRCYQYTNQLRRRLNYLQRLRIIKPMHQEEASIDINDSFVDKKKLEILDLSGNSDMKSLPTSLEKVASLQVLVLDGCDDLENVVLSNSSLRSFSFDGYGSASHWTSTVELPPTKSRPERPSYKKAIKVSKISLVGCTMLENLFLRGLSNLVELDLSGCAMKVLDLGTMVVDDVLRLKRLFLLGCEQLRTIIWGSVASKLMLELLCIDTRPGRVLIRPSLVDHKAFQLQVHAIIVDARIARCLCALLERYPEDSVYFNINIGNSTNCGWGVQPEGTSKEVTEPIDKKSHAVAGIYGDVLSKVVDAPTPTQAFPQPPTQQLDHHIEICGGSHNVDVESQPGGDFAGLSLLMRRHAQSLHMHDVSTKGCAVSSGSWPCLRWCCVERCSDLDTVFPRQIEGLDLETMWASDLLMARCIWAVDNYYSGCYHLRHLHLRSCPSLQYALPVRTSVIPELETLHIIHCSSLRHIFVLDEEYGSAAAKGVLFPKLSTIHLHDLPALRQICAVKMVAPALETMRIRGCWSLRRLPHVATAGGPDGRKPAVEGMEKDVWDALEWDNKTEAVKQYDDWMPLLWHDETEAPESDWLHVGHCQSLFEAPVHSRYYKRRMLKRTVLSEVSSHLDKIIAGLVIITVAAT